MKVGDYVRIKSGYIDKIININDFREPNMKYALEQPSWNDDIIFIGEKDIIKSSPDIIDLIEVGDYVNGYLIHSIYDDDREVNEYNLKHKKCLGKNIYDEDFQEFLIYEDEIKSIVTKEQFQAMEYRIN